MNPVRSFDGLTPRIADNAYVDPAAVVIGDVRIGAQSSIWPLCVVRGDIFRIEIGARSNVQDGSVLHVSRDSRFLPGGAPVILHDEVTIGHQVVLHGCEVHEHCLVGIGARVLDRAVLPPYTMVGAGAVVPPGKVLEGGYLWLGTPARRARVLTDSEMAYLEDVANVYVNLAARCRLQGWS